MLAPIIVTDSPTVRVVDGTLAPSGGPVRVCVTGIREASEIAEDLVAQSVMASVDATRLTVTAQPGIVIGAVEKIVGTDFAERLSIALAHALDSWSAGPEDLRLAPGSAVLPTSRRTVVQAVLNVTPDSFSDGGTFLRADGDPGPAIEAGIRMARMGADVVDVGGESTRPGAEPVPSDLELERTIPVVRALAAAGVVVSIDTTKAVVAREAVAAGAALVNDVSAGVMDAELLPTVAELGVPYVLMHMQGTPRTMQRDPTYGDVVAEVFDHLAAGLARLSAAGIPTSRVVVDPGIGFGKTLGHNLVLLRRLRELTSLGRPVLVGASRKSFIGHLTGDPDPGDRLVGSLAAATLAVACGARIVRAHDVAETVQAVAVADAVHG